MLVWQLKKSFSFKGNYWTKPCLKTFSGTAEHFQIKRGKAFADISNKKVFKVGGRTTVRAQPDWAYEFPDRTGPDTQICRTDPARPD